MASLFGGGGGENSSSSPRVWEELEQVDTEQLGFQTASGEDKLRLLPSPWPADNLPPPHASLLSVASTKGLVAAAGPDTLILATTASVRHTYANESADGNKIKNFTPQAIISIPRVSHVAFSSDESCLVIAAEQGGGLAVYDVNALMNGGKEPAFQLSTDGQGVRQLLPNPNPAQDLTRYFGLLTVNGDLLLADLKEQRFISHPEGRPSLFTNVSCACWSRLGKQIIAGLANGTAVQLDPQGSVKATIPEPPQLSEWKKESPGASAHPITSIFWLETNDFLLIHTPVNPPGTNGSDDSIYHLARREKPASTSWSFSKFIDPCPAFGPERKPAHHFVQRLREWLNLSDLLILASTASTDIGTFTRSKVPLDSHHPVTDTFTFTQPLDSRRAAMPVGSEGNDTSPIGMAQDLSPTEKISRPIPTDETIDESPVPLPALYVLNNEGALSMWWIIYNESVQKAQPYPDLVAVGGPRQLTADQRPSSSHAHPTTVASPLSPFGASTAKAQSPPFGQPAFGTPSQPSSQPQFGRSSFATPGAPASQAQSSTPAFGGASALGGKQSPWGGSTAASTGGATFGQPAFGTPSTPGVGFGQASSIGGRGSVWGGSQPSQTPQTQTSTAGTFGGNTAAASPFASFGNKGATSGFASLGGSSANQGGFAGMNNGSSGFAALGSGNTFGKPSLTTEPSGSTVSLGNGSSFGSGSTTFGVRSINSPSMAGTSVFGQQSSREETMDDEASETSTLRPTPLATENQKPSPFGLGAGGFKLESSFKPDGTAKDDLPKPKDPGAGMFGNAFGSALQDTSKAPSQSGSEGAAWLSGRSSPAVKQEPGTEETPKLENIPPAPVPAAPKAAPVDDAPLPPDPTTYKPSPGALPPPIPPGFGDDFTAPRTSVEAKPEAVPQSPHVTTPNQNQQEASLAGSPPIDLGSEKFSEGVPSGSEAGPPEEDDEEGEWTDEDAQNVNEDEDEDEDETQEQQTPQAPESKGLNAFLARVTPASPKRSDAQEPSTTPATADKRESYTPAGLPKGPIFPPPQPRVQESPRSPSPQRSATSPVRPPPSFGQPSLPNKPLPRASGLTPPAQQPFGKPATQQAQPDLSIQNSTPDRKASPASQAAGPRRVAVPASQLVHNAQQTAKPRKAAEPEAGDLEDEEFDRVQAILAAPIEPTTEIPGFLAHQDYVSRDSADEKVGLGKQIERVFRDINSMIDTLALNARNLQGFLEGSAPQQKKQKGRAELEEESGWTLGDAGDLELIMDAIEVQLDDGKLQDVRSLLEGLKEEQKETSILRATGAEIRKSLAARTDPDQLAQQKNAPLPLEVQSLRSELRQSVQKVQTLLAKAEEQLTLLRAELASLPNQDGTRAIPTVEAVTNTILKMTAMIERKSGDIDVLESQIRALGGSQALSLTNGTSQNTQYEDDLAASMRATRLGSPVARRGHKSTASISGMSGRFAASLRNSTRRSPGTPGSAGLKKSLLESNDVEVEAFRVKREARKKTLGILKTQLESRAPRVVRVGE